MVLLLLDPLITNWEVRAAVGDTRSELSTNIITRPSSEVTGEATRRTGAEINLDRKTVVSIRMQLPVLKWRNVGLDKIDKS